MKSDTLPQQVADVADAMYRRADEMSILLAHAIIGEVRPYGAMAAVPFDVVAEGCAGNMRAIFGAIAAGAEFDVTVATQTGIERARDGVPLPSVMEAYRVGFRGAWEAIADEATTRPLLNGDALRTLTAKLLTAQDLFTGAMAAGYRQEQSSRVAGDEMQRALLIDALIHGRLFERYSLWEVADYLRMPTTGPFVVIAADATWAGVGGLPDIEAKLRRLDVSSAWRGLAERTEAIIGDSGLAQAVQFEAGLVAGLLHAAAGQPAQAAERLRFVLDEVQGRGAVQYLVEPSGALARLSLADGRVGDALAGTDEAMSVVAGKGIWIWATEIAPVRVSALVAAGRADEAAELAEAFARGLRGRGAPAPKAALATCRALLAQAEGDAAGAAAAFGRAAAAWRALPRPYEALLAQERQASCLLAAGKDEAAVIMLGGVREGLTELGASGDADRVAASLREHGVTVPQVWRGGQRGYGDKLSPRELEVVRFVSEGLTNREIAEALRRSPNTVDSQLRSAMRKLKVSTRTALAVKAIEVGAVPGDRPAR